MTDKLKELAFSKWRGKPEVEAKRETMCWSEIFYAGWEAALAEQAPAEEFDAREWIMDEMATEQIPEMWLQQLVARAYAAGRLSQPAEPRDPAGK